MDLGDLKEAISYGQGEFDLDDVLRLAEEGKMQIYQEPSGKWIAVTEIVKYPKLTRLRVILMVGKFDDTVVDFFESLAKAIGLDGIEVIGRKGWVRALKSRGYKEASVNVVKDFKKKGNHYE